jgi:hypothetical protein
VEISCLLISTDTGVPITGGSASTALKIRRVADNALYDWNDATFKTSGWTTPTTTLTELTTVAGEYAKTVSESSWNDGYYQTIITYTGSVPQLHFTGEAYIYDGKEFEPANDAQISGVKNKVDTVDGNVDDIETLLNTVDGKVDVIDGNVDDIETLLNTVDGKVDTIDTVVDRIEIDTTSIESKVDTVDTVVDRIEVDTTSIESKVDIIDSTVDDIYAIIGSVVDTGLRDITMQLYETGTTTGIPSAVVTAYLGTDLKARQTTDGNGQCTIHLDDATYSIRLSKAGVVFGTTETIVVSADATKTIYGTPVSIPAAPTAEQCTVYEYCFDQPSQTPLASVTAVATILPVADVYGRTHQVANIAGTYNSTTGIVYWYIVRGAKVRVKIDETGVFETLTVPDAPSVRVMGHVG